MPECKWCLHFSTKTEGNFKDELNMVTNCAIGKLNHPDPNDTCEAWELDEPMVEQMEQDAKDDQAQEEALRRGYG